MRLDDVRMEALLPSWMRDNADDVVLSQAADRVIREIYQHAQLLTSWDKIDRLPEGVLDRLAEELDIEWYDTGASIETKRALIKTSDYVHAHKGTVAAVESIVGSYFGDGRVMEWFEYAGDPHHFKVYTTNPTLVNDRLKAFLAMLEKVKRKSSKLDGILIGLTGEQTIFQGAATHTHTHEVIQMGDSTIHLHCGVSVIQRDHVTVRITNA